MNEDIEEDNKNIKPPPYKWGFLFYNVFIINES